MDRHFADPSPWERWYDFCVSNLPFSAHPSPQKTLNLTCTVFGNPDPEVVWFKNDKDIELSEHFSVKVEQGKYVSMAIKGVTSEDSGKYSMHVKNKYGGEKIDLTVSVYKHGEKIPDISPPQQAKPKLIPASASASMLAQ